MGDRARKKGIQPWDRTNDKLKQPKVDWSQINGESINKNEIKPPNPGGTWETSSPLQGHTICL